MRNTFFDASAFAAGLNSTFDPTQTHFSYLEDSEIKGGGPWMAQTSENLHVTIQNTNHTIVGHYFYKKSTHSWRYHGYGGGPIPYGTHDHENLRKLQERAIEFAWPAMAFFVKKDDKKAKKANRAKNRRKQTEMNELLSSKRKSKIVLPGTLKPVRFPPPPNGMITEAYITGLITTNDTESLEYLFRSDDWPLTKWESEAWGKFLSWLTST